MLANVAVTDYKSHHETPAERPTDRIRNAGGRRTNLQVGRETWTIAERQIV